MYFRVIHTQYNLMYLCVSLYLYIHDTFIIHTQYLRDCIRYIHVYIRYIQDVYACICIQIHTNTLCLYWYVLVCISDPDTTDRKLYMQIQACVFIPPSGTGRLAPHAALVCKELAAASAGPSPLIMASRSTGASSSIPRWRSPVGFLLRYAFQEA